ncbi:MAG: Tim44 domain-containing protein [Pararhodobacter sp.]|nr:Tim44 domain-containing protein [Pararhodobacter sp.]
MDSAVIQLLVLAGIAVFLILRLRSVLGTREGYERPPEPLPNGSAEKARAGFDVIEGGVDHDIADHAPSGSPAAQALAEMKRIEPDFHVGEFLSGARQAYEMIVMGFERGDMDDLVPFLSRDVFESFDEIVQLREREGLTVEASFVGVREVELEDATFDDKTGEAEVTVRLLGELTSVVRNQDGEIVEGDPNVIKQQRDVWTFARRMGSDNPNWKLVSTGG